MDGRQIMALYLKFSLWCLLCEMLNLSKNDANQKKQVRDSIIYISCSASFPFSLKRERKKNSKRFTFFCFYIFSFFFFVFVLFFFAFLCIRTMWDDEKCWNARASLNQPPIYIYYQFTKRSEKGEKIKKKIVLNLNRFLASYYSTLFSFFSLFSYIET